MKNRGAGILLPIFSLPSAYGIGDVGPELRKFADMLQRCGQAYWQILPLNPTSQDKDHSPYNSISSMAGNPLFISPELLIDEGLLSSNQCDEYRVAAEDRVDYSAAERAAMRRIG